MARKKSSKPANTSWADAFWDFVETNPTLAATVAFQLGVLAGEAVSVPAVRSLGKRVKKMPQQMAQMAQMANAISGNLPQSLSATALKYLPGPASKLPPRKRPVGKPGRGRSPKVANAAE